MSPEVEAQRAARRIGLLAIRSTDYSIANHGKFQLIDARDGRVVAGQTFNLAADDVLQLCAGPAPAVAQRERATIHIP
jgi:hypothetical protein